MKSPEDILIVGAGPTGLAAAIFLQHHGIPFRIVEKREYPSEHSKAFAVNPRSLELFKASGITEKFLQNGRKASHINLWKNSKRILNVDFSKIDHPYPFMLIQAQSDTERILEKHLRSIGITVERQTVLEDLQILNNEIRATLKDRSGHARIFTPKYVLGADGGGSTIRKKLGINYSGSTYENNWGLYDIELETDLDPDKVHLHLTKRGAMIILRIEENLWRIAGSYPDLLEELPGNTRPATLKWQSTFNIKHKVVEKFQKENVFLAGDAAHLHSPVGGRGMNLGIEDAYVFAGLMAKGEVNRYENQRRPIVHNTVKKIDFITKTVSCYGFPYNLLRASIPLVKVIKPIVITPFERFAMGIDHEVIDIP